MFAVSCGQANYATCSGKKYCQDLSDDEKAMLALNSGDFGTAITLLKKLIKLEPKKNYVRYARIASAYVGKAGVDILTINPDEVGGKEGLGSFLPSPKEGQLDEYEAKITLMGNAVSNLESIPEKKVDAEGFRKSYDFQLALYQMSFSLMMMKKFSEISSNLENLDINDAEEILQAMSAAALASSKFSPSLQKKLDENVEKMDSAEGADNGEKMRNFLAENKDEI